MLDNDVVPWLHEKAFDFVKELEAQDRLQTAFAQDHLLGEQETHIETVKAEVKRKEEAKSEEDKILAIKAEEKRLRKEAREAKKRAEERAALCAEIDELFIKKGVSVEEIAKQELREIDGSPEKPVVGALGGMLGQLIITLALMEKNYNR